MPRVEANHQNDERQDQVVSRGLQKKHGPADTLVPDFQTQGLWEDRFLLFWAIQTNIFQPTCLFGLSKHLVLNLVFKELASISSLI